AVILPRHVPRVDLGADEQKPLGLARAQERVGDLEPVDEAGALLADVERRDVAEPELVLHQHAAAGELIVGRHGGEDHVVDVGGADAGLLHGDAGRARAQLRRAGAVGDVVALLDARALANPLIGGLAHARELLVLDEVLADDETGSFDDRAHAALLWDGLGLSGSPTEIHHAARRELVGPRAKTRARQGAPSTTIEGDSTVPIQTPTLSGRWIISACFSSTA